MRLRRAFTSLWVVILAVALLLGTGVVAAKAQADQRAQWQTSGHAKRVLTNEATVEARQEFAAHCGRCHSEQGFLAWLPQVRKGDPGLITKPDGSPADIPFLSNLGLNKFSVRPQTCTTCHNPDFSIRQVGATPLLPAGFRAIGVGLGAQCMMCHNTRNGAITWNTPDPKRYTAPHTAAQADVIMGKNSFFLDYGNNFVSPHATFTGDACVTCHMRLSKAPHTFKADTAVCSKCHGAEITAARVQGSTKTLISELETTLKNKILSAKDRIRIVREWDPKKDAYTENVRVDGASIVSVELTEIHGQQGFKFNLTGGRAVYAQMGDVLESPGKPTFATSDPLVRAGWNYYLAHSDGSFGVHNPRFVRQMILNTLDALK